MSNTPLSEREKSILTHLKKRGNASIQELADALAVSVMTIHRDLNKLVSAGHVHKKHGSVLLADQPAILVDSPCAMCGKTTVGNKAFIVHLVNGEQRRTCCPHCGLMMQGANKNIAHAMATDFLHNHMISASQAFYLIGSDLNICCIPSILTFGSQREAEQFQTGFGGKLVGMKEATQALHATMPMNS